MVQRRRLRNSRNTLDWKVSFKKLFYFNFFSMVQRRRLRNSRNTLDWKVSFKELFYFNFFSIVQLKVKVEEFKEHFRLAGQL